MLLYRETERKYMATPQQIEANRNNAQKSTGATSQTGKERSSLNATKHGFTGQNLVLSDAEKEAYEFHVLAFMDEYAPKTQIETNLVQQFADINWTLHQIAVQQHNLMSLINAMTEKLMKEGDLEALSKALAQPYRTLNTLGIYESRKRRAAAALQAELTAMLEAREAALKAAKQPKPAPQPEIGFVHSASGTETGKTAVPTFFRTESCKGA
jgi:hypothetical protein